MTALNRATFFTHIRAAPFGGHLTDPQVSGLTSLLDAFDAAKVTDTRFQAYMLATTFHETARAMLPVEEGGKGRGRAYGHPTGPWHKVYYGRGDVQETWLANYQKATVQLRKHGAIGGDVDLARKPELMLRPDIAAATLVYGMQEGWFTGRKLADYFTAKKTDWRNARRIINGTDCAAMIADYAVAFYAALQAGGREMAA